MFFLDNLYTVYSQNGQEKIVEFCDESHPIFQAHFPKNPILPAFLQIELIQKLFNIKITKIKKAKFINFITPNMKVHLSKSDKKISIFDINKKKISELSYE